MFDMPTTDIMNYGKKKMPVHQNNYQMPRYEMPRIDILGFGRQKEMPGRQINQRPMQRQVIREVVNVQRPKKPERKRIVVYGKQPNYFGYGLPSVKEKISKVRGEISYLEAKEKLRKIKAGLPPTVEQKIAQMAREKIIAGGRGIKERIIRVGEGKTGVAIQEKVEAAREKAKTFAEKIKEKYLPKKGIYD